MDESISAEEREQRELSSLRKLLKKERDEKAKLETKVDILTRLDAITVSPPDWALPAKSRKEHRGIANLLLSDLHLDEVVDIRQMRGKNKYNEEIAHQRLRRLGNNTIEMARDYVSGLSYDGIFVWFNGDGITGSIHEELMINSLRDPVESVDYWSDYLAALISQLADYFLKVHVVCTPGNHGRTQKKPPYKNAVKSNYDWLMSRIMWRELQHDDRITWNISDALDVREDQYNTRYLMQHGDDFKGGDQIAGAVRPVMMGDYRTLAMEVVDGEPYDMMLVGHFHQYHALPRAIINGSLVGYDEFAKRNKFRPEQPKQAFWITTPEHGPTINLPILVCDRDAEGW